MPVRIVADMPELRKQPPPDRRFILGLDLGQVSDPSALAVLERTDQPDANGKKRWHYECPFLKRWMLGTSYPDVVQDVAAILDKLPASARKVLCIDATGVGRAVSDLFGKAGLSAQRVPLTITSGHETTQATRGYNVPKRTLASCTQAVLQTRRLKIAADLKEAKTLQRELSNFKVKINIATAAESFEAWRESDHDDLVLAVAMALWWGEKMMCSLRVWDETDFGGGSPGGQPLPPGWRPVGRSLLPPGWPR